MRNFWPTFYAFVWFKVRGRSKHLTLKIKVSALTLQILSVISKLSFLVVLISTSSLSWSCNVATIKFNSSQKVKASCVRQKNNPKTQGKVTESRRCGPTNVEEFVLLGGPSCTRPMLLRLLSVSRLSCSSTTQTAPTPNSPKNQIKALCWCAMGQLGEGLRFFGSDSRNLSRGAQRAPFYLRYLV